MRNRLLVVVVSLVGALALVVGCSSGSGSKVVDTGSSGTQATSSSSLSSGTGSSSDTGGFSSSDTGGFGTDTGSATTGSGGSAGAIPTSKQALEQSLAAGGFSSTMAKCYADVLWGQLTQQDLKDLAAIGQGQQEANNASSELKAKIAQAVAKCGKPS